MADLLRSFTDHPELIRKGGRRIQHRNWSANAKRPADIPLRITTRDHRHRPPLCCGQLITRPMTEADHRFDIHSIIRDISALED